MAPIIFKKPPVVEVGISVQFPNTLEVADDRGRFHALIKAEFPTVIMPEISKLRFDFGDYALYTENLADRLEIGMNYFRFVTTSYPGFAKFRTMFLNVLSMFRKVYAPPKFGDLFMYYNNKLPIGAEKFEECFTLEVQVPEAFREKYFSGQGTLLFREPEGVVAVELKPEFKENEVAVYDFNLRFGMNRQLTFKEGEQDEVTKLIEAGHTHIERYFISLLQPKFVEFLVNR